jgi:hypothetical protein
LEVAIVQLVDLCLELLNLRLEPSNMFGQSLNLALRHVWIWLTVESEPPESILKEPEEGAGSMQVGLIDLPGHGIG